MLARRYGAAADRCAMGRALRGGAGPSGRARTMIGCACALGGGVVGRAGGVLTLCESRSAERPNEAWGSLSLLVPRRKCRRTPVHTHLHEGVEGARAGESVIGRVGGGGTRPEAAGGVQHGRGARGAEQQQRSARGPLL